MVPFAHANDGGGSTRIPAACVGLVGLKPQRNRISLAPELGEQFLVQDGVLTRTVRETAMLLDILAGPVQGDASWAPEPAEPFAATAGRPPEGLRVALTTTSPIPGAPLDPEHAEAVARTGELLRDLGHEVEEVEAPWGQDDGLLGLFIALFGPAVCMQIGLATMLAGREPAEDDMEPLSWWLWQTCKSIDSVAAQLASAQLQGASRALVTWSDQWDAVITPGLAEAPVLHGTVDPLSPQPDQAFARSGQFTPFTALQNVTGQPAIALPLFQRRDGLPLAVQVIGRPAREGDLLALAAQLEEAAPGIQGRPGIS
jgi:amidase